MNRLLIGNLNIRSIYYKSDQLKLLVRGKFDILVITENKLDSTFATSQVTANHIALIETETGVAFLFMFEMIYQILSKPLTDHKLPHDI